MNSILQGNCLDIMRKLDNGTVNVIMTSPPYNTSRTDTYSATKDKYNSRYDVFVDSKSDGDYIEWTIELFNEFERLLCDNGTVLYNLSYSSENTTLMFLVVSEIIKRTEFTLADTIIWKKKSAIPNNRSSNKLTRICEYIFVLCRKTEFKTFKTNKQVKSVVERTGQRNYENVHNFIEARNNDGTNSLNKATYSTELCEKLLKIYATPNSVILDPFMGTGTTALAAQRLGHRYLGCEISAAQCDFARDRIISDSGLIESEVCGIG